jgi:uncharacterized protein YacL
LKQSNVNNLGGYTDYLKISTICTLVFAIPCLVILLGFKSVELSFALFFLAISLLINSPIASGFAWLIKGADKVNKSMSLKLVGGMPGMFFGFLFGAFIASGLSNQLATIVSTLLFFSLGIIFGMVVGTKIGKRLLPME